MKNILKVDTKNDLQKAILGVVKDFQEALEGAINEAFDMDEDNQTNTDLATEDRDAEIGELIIIVNASNRQTGSAYGNGDIMAVTDAGIYKGNVRCGNYGVIERSEYEVIIEPEQVPVVEDSPDELTPNEKRDELIKGSKRFILTKINSLKNSGFVRGGFEAKEKENPKFYHLVLNSEFIVNEEKRTVVALLRGGRNSKVYSRGIAKCMPNEAFNVYIGKAIALARALEIDVPEEFVNAVQPDGLAVGQKIAYKQAALAGIQRKIKGFDDGRVLYECGSRFYICAHERANDLIGDVLDIISDTDAIYSEVELNGCE